MVRWRRSVSRGDDDDMNESESPSGVASIAHTLTSTIADGLVHTVAHWKVLLLGQSIALVLAIAGGTNEILAVECKVSAPSTYNAFGYSLIAIFGGIMLRRDMKVGVSNQAAATNEEQASFRECDGSIQGHNDDDNDNDELTDDESSKRRSVFASAPRNTVNGTSSNKSHGSDSKRVKPQYPFLFGLYTIHARPFYYFVVAFIEAQAYYLIFLAFRYTSFTFVYVSNAIAIPSAMLFTKVIMKRSYRWAHLIGGAICITGIVINTISDIESFSVEDVQDEIEEHASSIQHIRGDIFAISGAILLGLDDVLSEILVTNYGTVTEMLAMKGFFGALISFVQIALLERDGFYTLFSPDGGPCDLGWKMALFTAHVISRGLDVWGEMKFLFMSEAALLNLLLLTSDLYAALFDLLTVGLTLTPYFYVAFGLIFAGIVVYEAAPSPADEQHPTTGTPLAIEFHHRDKKDIAEHSSSMTEHVGNLTEGKLQLS